MKNTAKTSEVITLLQESLNINENCDKLIFKAISMVALSDDSGWYTLIKLEKFLMKTKIEDLKQLESFIRRIVIDF